MSLRVSTLFAVSVAAVVASACTKAESTASGGDPDAGVGASSGGVGADEDSGAAAGGKAAGSGGVGGEGGQSSSSGGTAGASHEDGGNTDDDGGVAGDGGKPPLGGSDPCTGAETTPNENRTHPTAYTVGTEFHGCLQAKNDVDFYEYTVPTTQAEGGVIVVYFTEVDANGSVASEVQGADNGVVISSYGSTGTSHFYWYNAKAGAKFRIKVTPWIGTDHGVPYTMRLAYTGVPDKNERNDTRQTATALTEGTAAHGYFFGGFENSTDIPDTLWDDWFKVTLTSGKTRFALTDVGSDATGEIVVYDSLGTEIAKEYNPTHGSSVVLDTDTVLAAGDYYVRVHPWVRPSVQDLGSTPAEYLSQPYTLTVSPTP